MFERAAAFIEGIGWSPAGATGYLSSSATPPAVTTQDQLAARGNSRVATEAAVALRPIPRKPIPRRGHNSHHPGYASCRAQSAVDPLPGILAGSDRAPRRPAVAPREQAQAMKASAQQIARCPRARDCTL